LVELARGKEPARRDQHLVQLVDERRLADSRIARDDDKLDVVSATPSIRPRYSFVPPKTCIKKAGNSGKSISLATSFSKLVMPRSRTLRGRREREAVASRSAWLSGGNGDKGDSIPQGFAPLANDYSRAVILRTQY
jgi:hypothetical protein